MTDDDHPEEPQDQAAFLSLLRTAAELEHGLAETLRPFGVTPTQYNVLRILRGAGARGLSRNEVGNRMVAQVPDATRLLDRMEAMGVLERRRDTEDRRVVTARITAQGLEVLARLDDPVAHLHARQFRSLTQVEVRRLEAMLERLRGRG